MESSPVCYQVGEQLQAAHFVGVLISAWLSCQHFVLVFAIGIFSEIYYMDIWIIDKNLNPI